MPIVKLGARPKSFKAVVKFPLLEGEEGAIEVVYRYRTRTEYGTFVDDWQRTRKVRAEAQAEQMARDHEAAVKAAAETGAAPPDPLAMGSGEFQRKVAEAMSDFLLEIVEAWNLETPFNAQSAQQLCDELPAAAVEIQNTYRTALTEGRLGN